MDHGGSVPGSTMVLSWELDVMVLVPFWRTHGFAGMALTSVLIAVACFLLEWFKEFRHQHDPVWIELMERTAYSPAALDSGPDDIPMSAAAAAKPRFAVSGRSSATSLHSLVSSGGGGGGGGGGAGMDLSPPPAWIADRATLRATAAAPLAAPRGLFGAGLGSHHHNHGGMRALADSADDLAGTHSSHSTAIPQLDDAVVHSPYGHFGAHADHHRVDMQHRSTAGASAFADDADDMLDDPSRDGISASAAAGGAAGGGSGLSDMQPRRHMDRSRSWHIQTVRTAAYMLEMGASLVIMSIFMLLNGWIALAIIIGTGSGFFLFRMGVHARSSSSLSSSSAMDGLAASSAHSRHGPKFRAAPVAAC
ncbi:hypothetical protein HK105_206017 [Polyrhizophydium stewartii]|uniref:Copper transport protein n=1 Tax=Polyrhizophydium stewartii TaxID=2732419 RepID=A0ABR4N4R4_9FUNG